MNEVTPLNAHQAVIQRVSTARLDAPACAAPSQDRGDTVEVSAIATLLAQMEEIPDVRQELVAHLRHQITSGLYGIEDKIDMILDRIIEDL
jgi:anti-sigma28 factor (negative regulator of flagellin synthesis)